MDILQVKEIKGYTAITKIPNMPWHIKGVLNLRGTIVPIVELRTAFGMPTIDYTVLTVIILVVVRDRIMGWWWIPCRMFSISAKRISRPRRSSEPKWM